jgi:hypothetical protein
MKLQAVAAVQPRKTTAFVQRDISEHRAETLRLGRVAARACPKVGRSSGAGSPDTPADAPPAASPRPPRLTFPYSSDVRGSAVQFNSGVSVMPAIALLGNSRLVGGRHDGYTASG